MVISGGDHIRFFTSKNLLDWEMIESFGYGDYVRGGVWECPDFFKLPVDGDEDNQKWVLSISMGANPKTEGSDTEYFIGSFDGEKFVSDHPAGTVLKQEFGKEMYATMSFSDIPDEDGRRISMGWMSNWDYPFAYPTSPWNGQMSLPREWSLKTNASGDVRMVQSAVDELKELRGGTKTFGGITLTPDSEDPLSQETGIAYEIVADLEMIGEDTAFEIGLRKSREQETMIGFNRSEGKIYFDRSKSGEIDFSDKFSKRHEAELDPVDGRLKLRMFVDGSSVEVFAGDGEVAFSNLIFPDGASDGMSLLVTSGKVKVHQFDVHPLKNVWKEGGEDHLQMDHDRIALRKGESHTLSVRSTSKSAISWSSSNQEAVAVKETKKGEAEITMKGSGRSIITAKSKGGKLIGETIVDSLDTYAIQEGIRGLSTNPSAQNGSKVVIGHPLQLWDFHSLPEGGYKVTTTDTGKALDASGSSKGDAVQLWEYFGYKNQQWRLTPHGDGSYSFNAINSGRSLRPSEDPMSNEVELDGVGVIQAARWRMIEAH